MRIRALSLGLAGIIAMTGCSQGDGGSGNESAQPAAASEAAGDQTISAGLGENSRFAAAAKAAGLDSTLAGPGPYTVLVPTDEAFGKLPAGTYDSWMRPEARAQVTGVLTYHILPGVVLAEDIGKAIENAKGKAVLATMGGETLTATREGDRIVLSDGAGGRAAVTQADHRYSNGVVHSIDAVLAPSRPGAAPAPTPADNGAAAAR